MKSNLLLCIGLLVANPCFAQLGLSTVFRGSGPTQPLALARDTNDNLFITGSTEATNLATPGAFQTVLAGSQDVFVAEFTSNGVLVFCTYLGGSGSQSGQGIALDGNGNIFVTGYTSSTNFPTNNPWQTTNGGGYDAFVTELSPGGGALVFSTYLGGSGFDAASGIALDQSGSPILTGYTQSPNFPTTNAAQPLFGGESDAFVTKFSPDASALVYSTFLGGSGTENGGESYTVGYPSSILAALGGAVAVDFGGNAYVTGWTYSTNFPVTNAFQPTNAALSPAYDATAFVTEFNPSGGIVYSTYFGGEFGDFGRTIGVDIDGTVYFGGNVYLGGLSVTNAYQSAYGGSYSFSGTGDGFLAALDATGTNLVYCTYLGGSGDDQINGLAVRPDGAVVVTGFTDSPDFPLLNAVQSNGWQGCFMTGNGGSTWSAGKSGLTRSAIQAIAVDPFNSSVLYALAGSVCKSTDGGQHWTSVNNAFLGIPQYSAQNLITFDPRNSGTLYLGGYYGVLKTTNGGATWTTLTNGFPANPNLQALAVDPYSSSTVYAGTYASGVFKSIDGGASWTALNTGLPKLEVTALLVDPLNPANVFAGIQSLGNSWLYKSTNGGSNWTAVNGLPNFDNPVVALAVNPASPSSLYALVGDFLINSTLCLTTNGGASWADLFEALNVQTWSLAVAAPPPPAIAIIDSGTNDSISWPVAATGYSLQFTPSLNPAQWQGVSQKPASDGVNYSVSLPMLPGAGFYRLVNTNAQPFIYLGMDQASQQGVLRSTDGGATWEQAGLGGNTIKALAVNPTNANMVYAGAADGYDAFVATFAPGGQLYFSTYWGASAADKGAAVAVDLTSAFMIGSTLSPDLPLVGGPVPGLVHRADPVETPEVTTGNALGLMLVAALDATICNTSKERTITLVKGAAAQLQNLDLDSTGTLPVSILVNAPGLSVNWPFLSGTPTGPGTITVFFTTPKCTWHYTFNIVAQ